MILPALSRIARPTSLGVVAELHRRHTELEDLDPVWEGSDEWREYERNYERPFGLTHAECLAGVAPLSHAVTRIPRPIERKAA